MRLRVLLRSLSPEVQSDRNLASLLDRPRAAMPSHFHVERIKTANNQHVPTFFAARVFVFAR